MGCGGSKIDDLSLVTLCRERKQLIKAASDHRYALAAAHLSYFESLSTVGEALRKFVDEELVVGHDMRSSSPSTPGSPVLTLPSDERKGSKSSAKNKVKNNKGKSVQFSSSTSISHSLSNDDGDHRHGDVEMGEFEGSHLHLSESESELSDGSGHLHLHNDSPQEEGPVPGIYTSPGNGMNAPSYGYNYPYANSYPYSDMHPYGGYSNYPAGDYSNYPPGEWSNLNMGIDGGNFQTRAYYMKKSSTPMKSMVFEEPESHTVREGRQWLNSGYGYNPYPQYGNAGFYGGGIDREKRQEQPPPPPPSPPSASTWDFLNIFETYENYYPGYGARGNRGIGSVVSSPDSNEVREREGIPDLEDEAENEMVKHMHKERKKKGEEFNDKKHSSEGTTSRSVPSQKSEESLRELKSQNGEGSSRTVPVADSESTQFSSGKGTKSSSPDTIVSTSSGEDYSKKKGVSFEVEEDTTLDMKSSEPSSLTTLPAHGTRDLQEVVREIKNEFEAACDHGKEVAVLLEVGKLPYRSKGTLLKVFSRIMYLVAPSMLSSAATARPGMHISSRRMKMAGAYLEDARRKYNVKSGNISSTLEKLLVWEKKLYKEVKDEERLRVVYQEKCKKLKDLDNRGADCSKIDATQASIRKLHTKIDVCIRTVDAFSSRIHKLRDEELQPQLTELIHGLIRMWRSMFKCHQKQFQAIMESKVQSFKANIGFRGEANFRAIVELEVELLKWCNCFNQWVNAQKSYIESLNGWLLRCINPEREQTADGVAPFSPGRIGAPPIFVICKDWYEAMENISEKKVSHALRDFASRLHQLWERQDEQQRQRTKTEHMSKDFEKQLRILRMERGKLEHDLETSSDKSAALKYTSESGVSRLDDLKVDLDSMRRKLEEERNRHKEAMKLVQDAASGSLQVGLVPIFETLGSFTSEVLKAYEQVRLTS